MSSSKLESTKSDCYAQKNETSFFKKMVIPQWLFEFAAVIVLASIFFRARYLLPIGIFYLLIRTLSTDLGRQCWKTVPRDLT